MLPNGEVQNFHAMYGASIVAPGSPSLLPQPPEFVWTRDGTEKQDFENSVAKRLLKRVGPAVEQLRRFDREAVEADGLQAALTYLSIDGAGVQVRKEEAEGVRSKGEDGEVKTCEAKVFVIPLG